MQDICGMDDAKSDVVDRSSVSHMDHEERRMSDLSDFCWSVVSSVDNHVNGDNQVNPTPFCGESILFMRNVIIVNCSCTVCFSMYELLINISVLPSLWSGVL